MCNTVLGEVCVLNVEESYLVIINTVNLFRRISDDVISSDASGELFMII